ncbi:efflux RND transporter periplasmic adaptor subunit [Patescibacteria group bacterium]|nr:efflux RND transporter periplasmic adaptor subunit [Patescibacteria group bacterium]
MKKILKHKWVFIIIGIILLILFFGERLLNSTDNTSSNSQNGEISSEEIVRKGNLTKSVTASGTIETANYLAITTSVNGIVKQVFVKEGDKIKKGQKIMEVTLDSEGEKSLQSAYSSYLRAKNSVDSAINGLKTSENTLIAKESAFNTVKETTSYKNQEEKDSFKTAENEYLVAKESYDLKNSEITQLKISQNTAWLDYQTQSPTVLSPSDGVISNVLAISGSKISNSVTQDRSVVTVASIKKEGTSIAKVNVTEMDIAKIKVGQKVKLSLTSLPKEIFEGSVEGIDKLGTISSGVSNYPVIIKFEKDSEAILPNMSVSAEIVLDEKQNVLYVPANSITKEGNKKFVNTLKGKLEVETGFEGENGVEITKGLNENDVIFLEALPTSGFTTTSSNTSRRAPGIFGIFGR